MITHFSWAERERLKYLFPFWIDMAVPIFMIISGYVYSLSYSKNRLQRIGDAYLLKNTLNKIIRYTIPFVIALIIEELYLFLIGELSLSLKSIFSIGFAFLIGGWGPGSYYYPVMMQFIFVFPIIYFIVKKYQFNGVMICGFINAMYELLQRAYKMNEECYAQLMFRYILLIAVGCYIANIDFKINKKVLVISCIVGIIFIICYRYLGYKPKIIIYWTKTSFVACLYIIPLAILMISRLGKVKFKPLEIFGRASYNIFLVQMVWYEFVSGKIASLISNRALHLFINLVACLVVGVIFYLIETPITKWINKKVYNLILE